MTTIIYTVVDIFYEIVYYQNVVHPVVYRQVRLENGTNVIIKKTMHHFKLYSL